MKKITVLMAMLWLAACQNAPQHHALAPLSFAAKPPIRLAVSDIRVVETYQSPMAAPHIEHQFTISPANAVKQWSRERLMPADSSGFLEITIEDASVKEVPLPKTKGVRGVFTDDQSERYDANLRVTMRLYNGVDTISVAEGSVQVSRSKSINEKATIADRESLFHEMTRDMLAQFDTEAELRLRQYFSPYIR